MRPRRNRAAATGLTALAVLASAAPATAEETTCAARMGAVTVDNLRVPEGARCILTGTRVQGTIKVERAGKLGARDVRVRGNVQAENAWRVNIVRRSLIGGSVQVRQGGGARVVGSFITGDLQYDANSANLVAARNLVVGSVQVVQNRGGVRIARNRIDGNLQCKENSPAPTGGGNVVQGNKEDQCAGL